MTINPIGTLFQYIQWDEYEGFIRNPLQFIRTDLSLLYLLVASKSSGNSNLFKIGDINAKNAANKAIQKWIPK